MKIAILGTRGIPNSYGGFEQFAEYLSVGLVNRGHSVTVYNVHFHEYNQSEFKGVRIKKIYSPEKQIGAAANFIYDYLCLKDALKQDFDIIYEAGYHSNSPSYYLLKKNSPIVITNMDGIEWKRSKWNYFTRQLIKRLEKIAVRKSDYLVSDNSAIQQYYKKEFGVDSFCIAYGADIVEYFNEEILRTYDVVIREYFLLIARLEPENNIEMILDGYALSKDARPFLVIGNAETKYGRLLQQKYGGRNIRFLGGIYDKNVLDSLRHYSTLYFHGHSVGGTNPSLLEAMASQSLIVAHGNPFNRAVLGQNAFYFNNSSEISSIICECQQTNEHKRLLLISDNKAKIEDEYSWNSIVHQYENLFYEALKEK
ncbi:glycosyltransferase involved in cell wall biosynthesis [Dysgonomonas alginatilytica]|uniref:Glycosyltransferase involved in cell wall biosynthesis n=1 Tax=Dysgonomonas alginatilytica TaxID=1605892 RepID=A0A2V3PMK5_9BACT|nr:DUF1972 domain-containing protein [Dysgonomonas alginatilytica]PXV61966.1 glycosyltransferase involved in cell wall biosynthesis [Dysgonomonas alginatilytica]